MVRGERISPVQKWHCLYTTGESMIRTVLAVACTTLAGSITYVVPECERWIIFGGSLVNCTLSSGTCTVTVEVLDENDALINYLVYDAAANTIERFAFPAMVGDSIVNGGGFPVILHQGQKIRFTWGASANKSGYGYIFAEILQFKVAPDW